MTRDKFNGPLFDPRQRREAMRTMGKPRRWKCIITIAERAQSDRVTLYVTAKGASDAIAEAERQARQAQPGGTVIASSAQPA